MKERGFFASAVLSALAVPALLAQGVTRVSLPLAVDARFNTPVIHRDGGRAYLVLTVKPTIAESVRRLPLNLCVVLDRSGSMSDDRKMEYARLALKSLVDRLRPDDYLSLVIYDDVVEVLREMQKVEDKSRIKRLIDSIEPRNTTNLGGGMIEGLRQVEMAYREGYANRVILLSDGLANQGITDPSRLNQIARRYRAKAISLTTMGVGLDYNENLMMGLAESGGGNYHFIEHPSSLASILSKEFHRLSNLVAENVIIELRLLDRIRISDVVGGEFEQVGERLSVHLGGMYAGEEREVMVEMEVPAGTGSRSIASGIVKNVSGAAETRGGEFIAGIEYTDDHQIVEERRDMTIQAKADVAASTRRVEKALEALDAGSQEDAQLELEAATSLLQASPAAAAGGLAGATIGEQVQKLQSYKGMMEKGPEQKDRAKKSIQHDNYKTQKQKN